MEYAFGECQYFELQFTPAHYEFSFIEYLFLLVGFNYSFTFLKVTKANWGRQFIMYSVN